MPLIATLVLGLVWLAFAAFRLAQTGALASIDGWLGLAPALALALVAAAFIPHASGGVTLAEVDDHVERLRVRVEALGDATSAMDVGLGDFAGRAQVLAQTAAEQSAILTRAATVIAAATAQTQRDVAAAERAAAALEGAMPRIAGQASAINATLRKANADATQQLRAVDAMLETVRQRSGETTIAADQAVATMIKLLADIDDTSKSTTSAISKRAYALDAAVDGAFERSTAMLDAMRMQTEDRLGAMETRIPPVSDAFE